MGAIKVDTENWITKITINRPKQLNAINEEVLLELDKAIDALNFDETRCLIITGSGNKAFVSGADISYMKDMTPKEAREFSELGNRVFRKIEMLPLPVIAAVNGFALGGGCELAIACDIRYSSSKARYGQPEISLGITPGFSGTQRLARIIGKARAMEMVLTGKTFDAYAAYQIGLVTKVTDSERLMHEVMTLAKKIVKNAPLAVKYATRAIKKGLEVDIEMGNTIETSLFGMCFETADQKEGMCAFLEKRDPEFTGN